MKHDQIAAASISPEQIVGGTIHLPPKPVGYYVLGADPFAWRFTMRHKPSLVRRWLMRTLLGFRWVDA